MVFLPSTDGIYPDIARYTHALDLSAKIRMHEIELVTRKWCRILRKLPDLTKSQSPSERYKLSVCIKGSCTTCIQAALYNFYGLYLPQLCARSFKEEEEDGENRGFSVFRIQL